MAQSKAVPTSVASNVRFFGRTRLVVDVFGPLINISKIPALSGTDARFSSESAIAWQLEAKREFAGTKIDAGWVLNLVRDHLLDSKTALGLVDGPMLELLCCASKDGMEVAIVTSVPALREGRQIYPIVRSLLLNYARAFLQCGSALSSNNFHYCPKDARKPHGVVRFLNENSFEGFSIVVDDGPPYGSPGAGSPKEGRHYDSWLSGHKEGDALYSALEQELGDRRRIAEACEFVKGLGAKLKLADYCAVSDFLVEEKRLHTDLRNQVKTIETLLKRERDGKPICVFLSGAPGSGKSYFVEQFVKHLRRSGHLQAKAEYPVTSLSGVSADRIDNAVARHIEQVFNRDGEDAVSIAFLDEVDVAPDGQSRAFRLLMDAMGGSRTDELGLSMKGAKSGKVARLVWFFAGSAGRKPEEFIEKFIDRDPKVRDFFDRIHFNLQLPGADRAAQAIVQALGSIHRHDDQRLGVRDAVPINAVEKNVLLLCGATPWTSVRQLDTVCRLAVGKVGHRQSILRLEHFRKVGTVEVVKAIFDHVERAGPFGAECLSIEWGGD